MKKFLLTYKDVPANPTLEFAREKLKEAQGSDLIISIGGGSTIDVGKYIAVNLGVDHVVTPTTIGTGSEATKYCVLNVNGKKTTFTDDKFKPSDIIYDEGAIRSLSRQQRASTILDALSQAFESLWSKKKTDESEYYASMAIDLIYMYAEDVITKKKSDKIERLLYAATFSGRAINIAPTNVCHGISYPLTDMYDIPHGLACAYTLPYFLNKFGYDERYVMLARQLIKLSKYKYPKIAITKVLKELNKTKVYGSRFKITKGDIKDSLLANDR